MFDPIRGVVSAAHWRLRIAAPHWSFPSAVLAAAPVPSRPHASDGRCQKVGAHFCDRPSVVGFGVLQLLLLCRLATGSRRPEAVKFKRCLVAYTSLYC